VGYQVYLPSFQDSDGDGWGRGVTEARRRQDHRYDIHQPDVHAIHARWRRLADRYGALLVGEVYEQEPRRLADYVATDRLHSSFWFGLVEYHGWEPVAIASMLRDAVSASPRLSRAQGNHDRSRAVCRYGGGLRGRRRWLALQALVTFQPGTAWLYQGEELGLGNASIPPSAGAEPSESRDGVRTPMPWSPEPGLGFTTGTPWLPDGGRQPADTMDVQRTSPTSMLHAVTRLLAVHQEFRTELGEPNLGVSWLDTANPEMVGYQRGPLVVAANLGDRDAAIFAAGEIVFDSDRLDTTAGTRVATVLLRPAQAIVLRRQRTCAAR
jgi:alpha-glucosidase